jgi:hypothetical protein
MAQFISFDDGLSYINTDKIAYFIWEKRDGGGKVTEATIFHMKDGSISSTSRSISDAASTRGRDTWSLAVRSRDAEQFSALPVDRAAMERFDQMDLERRSAELK